MSQRPVQCRYFYGDYHRGRNLEECRLIEANPDSRPWKRKLCESCPVPEVVMTSNSRDLVLEGEVKRKLIWENVEITFAICQKHMEELADPHYCPKCAAEQAAKGS